jgi:hypothetical protein
MFVYLEIELCFTAAILMFFGVAKPTVSPDFAGRNGQRGGTGCRVARLLAEPSADSQKSYEIIVT